MARNEVAKKTSEGMVLTFTFADKTALSIDIASLTQEIRDSLAVHGAKQKLGDSYAGKDVTVAYAKEQVQTRMDAWKRGEYELERQEPDQTVFNDTLAVLLSKQSGKEVTPEQAAAIANREGNVYVIDGKGTKGDAKSWQKMVRGTPDFIKAAAEIRAARASKPADLGSMLTAVMAEPATEPETANAAS